MTKRLRDAVEVVLDLTDPDPSWCAPRAFRWRGATYDVVAVLGHWREDAGYWAGGGVAVPQRDLWRVEARRGGARSGAATRGTDAAWDGAGRGGRREARGGVFELVREPDAWRLDRLWD